MTIVELAKKIVTGLPVKIQRDIFLYKNKISRSGIIKEWEVTGRPLPPPHQYKQHIIEQISKQYNIKTFIETGTLFGVMIEAQRKNFSALHSIEVEPTLYSRAHKYFAGYKHISIIEGDSALKLKEILKTIDKEPILFWLDGHYSGGITGMGEKKCPVFEELETIFNNAIQGKYILIDDARCFNGTDDYPTMIELNDYVYKREASLKLEVLNDIIHIH